MGLGLRFEDVSGGKKMYFEQTCVAYLFVRPSVGRGLRLEDVCISRQEDVLLRKLVLFT